MNINNSTQNMKTDIFNPVSYNEIMVDHAIEQAMGQGSEYDDVEFETETHSDEQSVVERDIAYDNRVRNDSKTISQKMRLELYDWLQCIVTAVICGVLIFIFVGRTIGVDGVSMLSTLRHNDRVIISNLFYTPNNGDIIVFESSSERFEYPLVKRVIAIPGQTLDMNFENGDVIVDGIVIDEPYIDEITTARHDFTGPVYVPDGYVFVLGDNRNRTTDSRSNEIGLVDTRYILGRVIFVLIPGQDSESQRDWSRFGIPE